MTHTPGRSKIFKRHNNHAPCQEGEEESKHHLIKIYFSDLWLGKSGFQKGLIQPSLCIFSFTTCLTLHHPFLRLTLLLYPLSPKVTADLLWAKSNDLLFTTLAPFWLLSHYLLSLTLTSIIIITNSNLCSNLFFPRHFSIHYLICSEQQSCRIIYKPFVQVKKV